MNSNVGGIDKTLRIIVGVALVAWAAAFGGPTWAWIGVVPLVTGVIGFCPLYPLIGRNSCCSGKTCSSKKD